MLPQQVQQFHQLKKFHQLVLQDSSLKERLRVATDEASLVSIAVQLGNELGYNFTYQEVKSYIDKNIFILMRQFLF
ncbi:Nif11 family protein [Anabaena azotica]|uniref:Nif11 family protein n=1 Tax=Anabaena azotica FACHB-119 TaxID=947527 RepID=A0ABR8CZ93_9NOST|nr:Nif11 family protein [Anabaena azotica]MBD2500264.1 Nif11 family protein [Anabaena azotica FACHB-119]